MCEHVSIAPSKGRYPRNAEGCLGKPSLIDPSQLINLPVSLLDLVCEDPALEKLNSSSYLHSGFVTCHDDLCLLISQGFCLGQVFVDKNKEHFGFHQNQLLPCYWSFQSCHLHIHQLGMRRQLFRNSPCPHPGSALTSCFHDPLNTYWRIWRGGCVHKHQACTHDGLHRCSPRDR